MAGVAFVLCSLSITFDPNVEKDAEEKDKGDREEIKEGEDDNLIRTKMKKVFDFSVWKVPPVIAIVLAACVVEFGHFVPQIHLVSYYIGTVGNQFGPRLHVSGFFLFLESATFSFRIQKFPRLHVSSPYPDSL